MDAKHSVHADTAGDWSADACRTVAQALTSSLDLGLYRDAIVDTMVWMHVVAADLGERVRTWTGRQYHRSPQHILAMLHSFSAIMREQYEQLEDQQRFRLMGLEKLHATVAQVEDMQALLSTKRTRLEAANVEANDRLQLMVQQQQAAETKREASIALQSALQQQEADMAQQRASVLQELSEAEPALLDAQAAVSNIKKQHLSEVRSMTNPPAPVKLTMESVCMLLGHRIDGWKTVQSLIRRDDFISTVVHLDTASIPHALRERLQREYLNRSEYNLESIHRASTACGPLARWVLAQVHYAHILERVEPLRAQVHTLEAQAADTRLEASRADTTVAELENSIAEYKREYASLISEIQALTNELQAVEARVARSVRLLDGLSSERERWEQGRQTFDAHMQTVAGDSLMCAAMVAYAGFFDQACREALWRAWLARLDTVHVPVRRTLSFADTLSTADERAAWHDAMGLRSDALSIDNAVILQRCTRVPLLIDPSGHAVSFASALYARAQPAVTSFLDGGFVQVLERALRFGTPLIISDAEHLDPVLMPVLNAEKRRTGGRTLVRVGTADVDWAPSFCLVLTTRYAGVVLPPHVFARVQVINFTMTRKSLEAQALSKILHYERPDIEAQRADLERMQNEFKRRLLRLEHALLTALNEAQGHILEDDHVVSTLETLKAEADDISRKAASTESIVRSVAEATHAYEPLASACSALYFLLEHMQSLHAFYAFDMRLFERLLTDVLSHRSFAQDTESRRHALYDAIFVATYRRAAPALLHADRLVLAIALAQLYCRAGPRAGALDGADFFSLLHGSDTATLRLAAHDEKAHPDAWRTWISQATPELVESPLPHAPDDEIGASVRQALLLRTYRPDRLEPALVRLVHHVFGAPLLDMPLLPLQDIVEQVSSDTPLALFGVAGYDASGTVESCAASLNVSCAQVALGSPEAMALADRAMASAARSGSWVLVKNAHLAPTWLAQLPARLAALCPHERCRVCLTCELSPSVPPAFVRAARIVMHEPPAGCKSILLDALQALDMRDVLGAPTASSAATPPPPERERVYLLVAVLHMMVLERARHVPQGWSRPYEFYDTDLDAAYTLVDTCFAHAAQTKRHLAPEEIPWLALRTLLAQDVYGCRMDSDADRKMLDALLAHLFTPAAFESEFVLAPDLVQPLCAPDGVRRELFRSWAAALPEPQPVSWVLLAPAAERVTAAQHAIRALQRLQTVRQCAEREQDIVIEHASLDQVPQPSVPAMTTELAAFVDTYLAKLPSVLAGPTAGSAEFGAEADDPLGRFWARERRTAFEFGSLVRADLVRVSDILAQRAPRTSPMAALIALLEQGDVPVSWRRGSSLPLGSTLRAWLDDLCARVHHATLPIHERVELGQLWSPSAYLTAARQMTTRETHASLEQLELHWVLDSSSAPPHSLKDAAWWPIGSLWLDGGVWKDGCLHLNDGASTSVSHNALLWTCRKEADSPPQSSEPFPQLSVPVFLDAQRQHFLCHAHIPIAKDASMELAVLHAVAIRLT